MGYTKKSGSECGKIGGKISKRGPSKKTHKWKELELLMTEGKILDKVTKYMNELEGEELFKAYKDLLNYFKPQMARVDTTIKGETQKKVIYEIHYFGDNSKENQSNKRISKKSRIPG
jgi:hypothetical protein